MNIEPGQYKYFAFISYSHQDKSWGDWLHRALETYRVPQRLVGTDGRDGVVPKRAFPVFRDREELPGSADLGQNINDALQQSRYLIVICSPRSAQSKWVNEEIKNFKALGREDRVLCLIVDGEPNAGDKPELKLEECFPEAVRYRVDTDGNISTEQTEPIAADAREGKDGKSNARLKLLAGVLGVPYDSLKQRDQARRMRRLQIVTAASLLLMTTLTFLSVGFYQARNLATTERNNALTQLKENYRFLGHTAFLENNPEHALLYFNEVRRIDENEARINLEMADAWASISAQAAVFPADEQGISRINFSSDGTRLISQDNRGRIKLIDIASGETLLRSTASGSYATNSIGHHYSATAQRIAAYMEPPAPDKSGSFLRQVDIIEADGKASGIILPGLWPDLLNMSPQGSYLLTSANDIGAEAVTGIWSLDSGQAIFQPLSTEGAAGNYTWRFSANDDYLFQLKYAGDAPYYMHRRDAVDGNILNRYVMPNRVEATAMWNDLAAFGCVDGSLQIYRVTDGTLLWENRSYHSSGAGISSLSFSADGGALLSVDIFGQAAIWNSRDLTTEPVWQIKTNGGVTNAADLSADGSIVAIGHDKKLSVYSVGEKTPLSFQDGHDDTITAVSLSAAGDRVAVASNSGQVKIWEVAAHTPRTVLTQLPARTRRITQNTDQSFLAYADALFGVWPSTGTIKKVADEIGFNQTLLLKDNLIVDYNYGWMSLIKFDENGIIARNDLTFNTDYSGLPDGQLGIPPGDGPVAVVYAAPGDSLYAFDRNGATLPQGIPFNTVQGNPASIMFNAHGNEGTVSFTDQNLLHFVLSAQGVVDAEWYSLPTDLQELQIADWIDVNSILLRSGTKFYRYDLNSKALQKIPRDNLVTARALKLDGKAMIVTTNVQGVLEVWNSDVELLVQNQLARGSLMSDNLLSSSQVIVGKSMAVSADNKMIANSINDRIYIWDVVSGDLLWRSSPIENVNMFNRGMTIEAFVDQDRKLIVSINENTTLVSLSLGGEIPALDELDQYLNSRLKLGLRGGRIVRHLQRQ